MLTPTQQSQLSLPLSHLVHSLFLCVHTMPDHFCNSAREMSVNIQWANRCECLYQNFGH